MSDRKVRRADAGMDAAIYLLLALFALFVVSTLMIGVDFYHRAMDRKDEVAHDRIAVNYLYNKVRGNDVANCIGVRKIGDMDVLVLRWHDANDCSIPDKPVEAVEYEAPVAYDEEYDLDAWLSDEVSYSFDDAKGAEFSGGESEEYETLIYCYDGALREAFVGSGDIFEPGYGERVCNAESFGVTLEGGLLTMRIDMGSDKEQVLHTALRCAGITE